MDVVVDTARVVETCWLPELTTHLSSMVPVQQELRHETDGEKSNTIGLATREEASTEVAVIFHSSFICPHLHETVERARIGHYAVR